MIGVFKCVFLFIGPACLSNILVLPSHYSFTDWLLQGKTLIGCVWSKAFLKTFTNIKIIVLCPVSLKSEWKRTAIEATSLQVSDTVDCCDHSTDVCICSWAKIPSMVPGEHNYLVVADEAHSMQSMQSTRTKEALKLMASNRCIGALLLTGTPMKNGKPSNLFPLLKAVNHPFGHNQRAYETHFCAGHQRHFGASKSVWQANGATNLGQLREHAASHLLHLTKDAVLKDLPPQTRKFHYVPVSSRSQLQHNQALQELARVFNTSNKSGENQNDAILGAVQKVRLVGSLAKIDATVQLAKNVLSEEAAVVIFTSFVEVAKAVHKQLSEAGWKGELLTGETAQKKRQAMVDNFQNGLSPVFTCTFGAGGVGLTLTAACTVILLDRPWTPGDAHQAEDRVRRIGQTKPVKSIWVSAFDLDKQIDDMLAKKNENTAAVLTDSRVGSDNSAVPKLSIFQMLRLILPAAATNKNGNTMIQTSILQFSQGTPTR